MKKANFRISMLLITFVSATLCVRSQPSTTQLWAKNYNNTKSTTADDYGRAVTADAAGNVYVTGTAYYANDSYIQTIKYDKAGSVLWSTGVDNMSLTGCYLESGYAIAVDGSSNVWVAATSRVSGNQDCITLIKYNSSGAIQSGYPKEYVTNGCGGNLSYASCIAISGTDVYVGGSYYNNTNSNYYCIVLKNGPGNNNTSTTWAWSNTPYLYNGGISGSQYPHAITDIKVNSGNTEVFATGYSVNSSGNRDAFTVGLDASSGSPLTGWPQVYPGSSGLADMCNALSIDPSENYIYVAGYTTSSTTGKDGLLIKYTTGGSTYSGFPVIYDQARLDDAWSDIEVVSTSSVTPAVYVGGYCTLVNGSVNDVNYALMAYKTDGNKANGVGYWTTDPVFYNGNFNSTTIAEASGADMGYGIEYSSTTNRIYITGTADEGTSPTHNVNITTIGYNATTGSTVWGAAKYDLSTDALNNGIDESYWKYGLKVLYSTCYLSDQIYVEGASQVSGHGFDYVTLKYGNTGLCSEGPQGRLMNTVDNGKESLVYPNPFSEHAELKLDPSIEAQDATLLICDVTGRLVKQKANISETGLLIERGDLAKGLYFYKLVKNGLPLTNGKFLIVD